MMSKSHSSQSSSSRASTTQFKKQEFGASKHSSHSPKYSSSNTKSRTQQPYRSSTGHSHSSDGSSTTKHRNSSFGSPTGQFSTQSHMSPSAASCGSSTAWPFEDRPYGSSTATSLTQPYGSPATESWTPSYGSSAAQSYLPPAIQSPPHSTSNWSAFKNTVSSVASYLIPSSDPEKKRELRRKERLKRKVENQQKFTEIYTRYEKALMKRSEAQEQWQQVNQDIVDLDNRISESIERGEATQEVIEEAGHKWKGQFTQNQLYQDCKRELESLEEAKKAKSVELEQAEDELNEAESAYKIYRRENEKKRRNDAKTTVDEIRREIDDFIKSEKEAIDKLSTFQDTPTQQTQFTEDSPALVEGQQGPAQLKQDLENLRVEKERLTTELKKAETEENKVRAEKEDFEKNVQQMEQLDRQQHTYIMIWLHDNLKPEEVESLKMVLCNNGVLTRHEESIISSFKGLWQNLADKQYVSVGNYAALRKDIEDISMKKLAAEIAEMEDDLLRPYDEQAKTLGDLHDAQYDTFTKRLDRHFKSIKEDDKAYKESGGPFKYLKHVVTVAKHYLGELEEKSQSSKALQKFFDEKLKKNEILAVANTHAEEHKSGTAKSKALEESLKQANAKIDSLNNEKTKLDKTYGQNISKLEREKTKAEKATADEKEKIKKIEKEYKEKEGKAKKDWEKWKKELEEENTRLRIERDITDRKFRDILDLMDGFKQIEVERFEEKEREKDIMRAEEVKKDKLTIQQIEGKLDEERDARRSMNDDNMRKRQKSYEDYGNKLIAFGERAMESETKIREEAREELMNVQAECGENMLLRSQELMALRRELLEANLTNMFDKYEIGEREKKIKNLERKLSLANARIQKFQDGRQK